MRSPEYSDEQIIEAGKKLRAEGRGVTGFGLRETVGGGSFKRLKQVWDDYIKTQSTDTEETTLSLPTEVEAELDKYTASFKAFAIKLNSAAVKASEQRVAHLAKAAEQKTEEAGRELLDASRAIEHLETQLEKTQTQLTISQQTTQSQAIELGQLRKRLAAFERSNQRANEDITQLRSMLAKAEQAGEEADNRANTPVRKRLRCEES